MYGSMTPTAPLIDDEQVVQSFHPDRMQYWRDHAWMAAGAMAIGMAILWAMGNPHVWTGAVGGLAAIALRAFYVASDELNARWDLTDRRLMGPQDRIMTLGEIARLRGFGSAVQVITRTGDKHLIKYLDDRPAVIAAITGAAGLPQDSA